MDHEEWLAKLVSADKNRKWEALKTLAAQRLAIAPGDLNAIVALKKANLWLNPALLEAYLAERDSAEKAIEREYRYPDNAYTVIEPLPASWTSPPADNPSHAASIAKTIAMSGVVFFLLIALASFTISHQRSNTNITNADITNVAVAQKTLLELRRLETQATGESKLRNLINEYDFNQGIRQLEIQHGLASESEPRSLMAKQATIGSGGWVEGECRVKKTQNHILSADLSDNPRVYVAIPFTDALIGRKVVYRWEDPNGTLLRDSAFVQTTALRGNNQNNNCIQRVILFEPVESTSFMKLEILVDGDLFYQSGIFIIK